MSSESVLHTVGVLTCATTLSLFSTIVAFAAVNVAPLRWDGSMCANQQCSHVPVVARNGSARVRLALAGTTAF